jgi:hypothetical protein
MDLDAQFRHPGCTIDKPYEAPRFSIASMVESAGLSKTATPAVFSEDASTVSGSLTVQVTPYQYRAPILCSDYKISLDQTITVRRATEASRSSVKPVLHWIYLRETLEAPADRTYDATSNSYMPNPGFVGSDTFKIRINDRSGEQDVTIVVKVI